MRTTLTILAGGLLAASQAAAQVRPAVSLYAGANLSTMSESGPDAGEIKLQRRLGPSLGAQLSFPTSSGLRVDVGLGYAQKGTKMDIDEMIFGARYKATGDISIGFIEAPVTLRLSAPESRKIRPFAEAGASVGVRVSCTLTMKVTSPFPDEDTDHCDGPDDEISRTDVGAIFGTGIEFRRFTLRARYDLGLKNLDTSDDGNSIKTRTLSIGLGVRVR